MEGVTGCPHGDNYSTRPSRTGWIRSGMIMIAKNAYGGDQQVRSLILDRNAGKLRDKMLKKTAGDEKYSERF